MKADTHTSRTRVWWDGGEVLFVRWTDQALVFSWSGVRETAIHMPRGAVVRLLEKGVLYIEGEVPDWMYEMQRDWGGHMSLSVLSPLSSGAPLNTAVEHPKPRESSHSQPGGRQSIIKRLINKLAGI